MTKMGLAVGGPGGQVVALHVPVQRITQHQQDLTTQPAPAIFIPIIKQLKTKKHRDAGQSSPPPPPNKNKIIKTDINIL